MVAVTTFVSSFTSSPSFCTVKSYLFFPSVASVFITPLLDLSIPSELYTGTPWYSKSDVFPSPLRFLYRGPNDRRASSDGQKTVSPAATLCEKVSPAPSAVIRSENALHPCLAIRDVRFRSDGEETGASASGELLYGSDEGRHRGGGAAVDGRVVDGGEADLPALDVGDVDVSGGAGGLAGGLEEGGGGGGALGDLVELLGAEVVGEDVEGEDVFDGGEGIVVGEEVGHGGVVDGADGDGAAAVDLGCEVGRGEVVVEGGEVGVIGEDAGDVVGADGGHGGAGEDEKDGEGGGELLHFLSTTKRLELVREASSVLHICDITMNLLDTL
ncbi:nuclear protein X1 [Striga asiatica]|uniref:Nuclear protein X1 n=1 Tax=Striga asiatica TaxID=4170 RepID=A0A5A7PLF7_STRAF|nr:nuclear protein X1 [Striga asiatica]